MNPKAPLSPDRPRTVRFGVFEFNLTTLELKNDGRLVSMQQQPASLLQFLVLRANRVVSREELQNAIWPTGTHVEFNDGLNTAINRIRRALSDSAEEPRFIQTIPRVGYRFVAPVEHVLTGPDADLELAPFPPQPEIAAPVQSPPARRTRIARPVGAAIAIAVVITVAIVWQINRRQSPVLAGERQVIRYTITLPPEHAVLSLAISPRGDQLVYQSPSAGTTALYRRFLDSDQSRLIAGTDDARAPFFSPDGSQIGFYTRQRLRIVTLSGVRDLTNITGTDEITRAFWADDGYIYFNNQAGRLPGIWRIPEKGGAPELVLSGSETPKGIEFIFTQQLIPGTNSLLYSTVLTPRDRGLRVISPGDPRTDPILARAMGGQYLPTGHLLYYLTGNLMAVPFNAQRLRVTGTPAQVVANVAQGWGGAIAGVSGTGTLVYLAQPELEQRTLAWIGRNGNPTPLPIAPAAFEQVDISPDGGKLAVVRRDAPERWSTWIHDLHTHEWALLRESTIPRPRAIWSPDSHSLVVSSEQQNGDFVNLYRVYLDTAKKTERLTEQPNFGQFPTSWSAQANTILFEEGVHPATKGDLLALPLDGRGRSTPFVALPGWDLDAVFSPDGKWVAYTSDVSGKSEIYVSPYPPGAQPERLSTHGGTGPQWARTSGNVLYVEPNTGVMEVAVQGGRKLREPKRLFAAGFMARTDIWTRGYSLAPDGRLLVIRPATAAEPKPAQIQVVVNWTQKLKELSPVP
jgi:eukaryotic-like serine/threonine-protein kinase